jgi:hypothetical protein
MGLGGGCELMEGNPVICTPRSGVDVPGGDVTNSMGGESI